jgi:PAS domain S-box-containing protein
MKGRVSIERIATARQRLAELSELGNGPPGSVSQVQQAVDILSSVLDELEKVAQDGQLEQEADNESRFNTLAETASDGIISIDDQSTIRYVNPAAGQMFGYEPAEMLNKSLTVLMPERFRQIHLTSFRRYLATGQRHIRWRAIELVGLHKSGREFPIEISFGEEVRKDKHFFTGIVRDVTDRTLHAEIHAAFSGLTESGLQPILQLSADAIVRHREAAFARIWTINDQGNMLELQASAGQYTRLDGEHARVPVGKLKIGLIAQERKPHLTNDVQNDERISHPEWAKREGMVAFAGYPLLVDGRLVGVLAMFARKSLEPAVLQTLALVADTIAKGVERKWAEKKLQESERNLRLFMETIPQMLWSAAPDGAIDYYNQRVLDYTGLSMDELRGAGWIKPIHPDERDAMTKVWAAAVAEGVPFNFEFRGRRGADGMYRWCVSSALPLRDREGRILKWYGSVVDLHDWKQAQESLRSREAELAHITRIMTMGEITSSIAHEINQPLGAIVNYGNACLRIIKTGSAEITDIAAALSEIVDDANRASAIIAQIRALSKKALPEMAVLEVKDLVAEILPLVRHELDRRQIVLKTVLSDNLSPVMGDRIQLEQVLLNLVMNGMEAMHQIPEDRRHLSIAAQSQVSEGKALILISVTDSGIGLSAEDQPRLFEAFYTTKAEGMGMGLAISRSIVEAHGGRLWATPNTGRGATFQFVLPAQTQQEGVES